MTSPAPTTRATISSDNVRNDASVANHGDTDETVSKWGRKWTKTQENIANGVAVTAAVVGCGSAVALFILVMVALNLPDSSPIRAGDLGRNIALGLAGGMGASLIVIMGVCITRLIKDD